MIDSRFQLWWREWRTSLCVGLVVMTVWTACFRFPVVWQWTGIGEANRPFLDLYGLLASGERSQAGFDSFQPNPLDPYHRPNIYIDWWLLTGTWGFTRADTAWLGAILGGMTLVAALVVLKPRPRGQAFLAFVVLLSPPLLMAVHRANNDLVVFLFVSVALVSLRANRGPIRSLAVVLLAISAALKYYPLAGLVVLLEARSRREFAIWVGLYGLVLMLAWPALTAALESAGHFKPRPEWLYAFGAPMLWRNFHLESPVLWLVPTGLMLAWAAWNAWNASARKTPVTLKAAEEREFAVGSAFIAGCFFLGASYVYKLVFALWLLPWLWRSVVLPIEARWREITRWLLVSVLWLEGLCALMLNMSGSLFAPGTTLRLLYVILTGQQLLTWAFVGCLLRWLFIHAFQRLRVLGRRTNCPLSTTT